MLSKAGGDRLERGQVKQEDKQKKKWETQKDKTKLWITATIMYSDHKKYLDS